MNQHDDPQTQPGDIQTIVRKTATSDGKIGVAGLEKGTPVVVRTMPIWQLVLIRVARTYISTFLGMLTIDSTGLVDIQVLGNTWNAIGTTALISLAPTLVSLLHNAADFLMEIDVKNPGWRA
jgi:hypothetical protein